MGIVTYSGQVLYTVVYDETTTALDGAVAYDKALSLNTGNKVASQSNLKADKIVTFAGIDAGTLVSSENILVDGAGQFRLDHFQDALSVCHNNKCINSPVL